jgi:hypothetical protein
MTEKQHRLTAAERRAGQAAGAATKRRRRAEAEQIALDEVAILTTAAVAVLKKLLDEDDFRAAKEVLDRVLGRPRQQVDVGWPKTFDPSMLTDKELDEMHTLLLKSQPEDDDE